MSALLARLISSSQQQQLQAALTWLYSFVKPQKSAILRLLGLSTIATFLVLLQPWLTKTLIDDGLLARDYPMLLKVAFTMIGVGLLGTLLGGLNRYLHTQLSGRILFALRSSIYQHLQQLSPNFYAKWRVGELFSRIDGDVAEIQRFAVDALFAAISSVIGFVGALVLLLTLSWKLSLLVLILLPIELLWLSWMRKKVERHARTVRERATDISAFMVETLPAMKFIQSVVQEPREAKRLDGLSESYLQQLLQLQVVEFFTQAVPNTLISWTRAAAFMIGGYWVIQGTWQLGALIAFSTYLGMVIGPAQSLLGLYVSIQKMSVSLLRVQELQQAQPSIKQAQQVIALPTDARGELSLVNLSFTHAQRENLLFDQLNGQFTAGAKIALIGPSGSGKSTLIDVLQRFYDPQHGTLLLDGIDIRQFDLAEYRRCFAVVSQDIVLFRGSLAENLRYVAPAASDQQLWQALEQVQLLSWVESLGQGLASPLGERGQQLSGGQKQRLAIARALLQQPLVLVLDEATSAVDEATEADVVQAIDLLFAKRTRIYISHRSSTWKNADYCLQLKNGQLERLEVADVS